MYTTSLSKWYVCVSIHACIYCVSVHTVMIKLYFGIPFVTHLPPHFPGLIQHLCVCVCVCACVYARVQECDRYCILSNKPVNKLINLPSVYTHALPAHQLNLVDGYQLEDAQQILCQTWR